MTGSLGRADRKGVVGTEVAQIQGSVAKLVCGKDTGDIGVDQVALEDVLDRLDTDLDVIALAQVEIEIDVLGFEGQAVGFQLAGIVIACQTFVCGAGGSTLCSTLSAETGIQLKLSDQFEVVTGFGNVLQACALLEEVVHRQI